MLADLDADEYQDWLAFMKIEMIGPERNDHQAGIITSMLANVNRDPKKRRQPFSALDFMPYHQPPRQSVSAEDQIMAMEAMFRGMAPQ